MANINNNIIMQAGAAVANAAHKAAGLSAATPEPGSIISVIQLVNGGRTIGPDALAHFTESVRNKLLSLLVSMEPIQDFHGYGHPWAAGGGKNKLQLLPTESTTSNGVTFTVNADGTVSTQGTATGTAVFKHNITASDLPSGENLILNGTPSGGDWQTKYGIAFCFQAGYPIGTPDSGNGSTITPQGLENLGQIQIVVRSGIDSTGLVFKPMIRLASVADATFAPYANICPMSGRTGLHVYAGPTSAIGDAATYSMTWTTPAGTVYAGSADIVSGDIKAAPYYASYNGETLVGPWVSSMDEYDPEETPTTGAQVVDLGGTMTEYHITGQDIITLVGDNYIWSDSGDVTIKE